MDTVKDEVNSGQMIHTIYLYYEDGTDRYGNVILQGPAKILGRWIPGTARDSIKSGVQVGDQTAQCILPDIFNRELTDVDGNTFTVENLQLCYIHPHEDVSDPESDAYQIEKWNREVYVGGLAGQVMVFV